MNKRRSVNDNLKQLAERIGALVAKMDSASRPEAKEDAPDLKVIEGLVRLRKAMLEMGLLEEEWNERRRQRRGAGGAKARKSGISAEALEEIGRLLGLNRPDDHQTHQNN